MNICLYGASSDAIDESYISSTETLGEKLAARGHCLVYGGGAHGLMGAAARGVTRKGGKLIGVAPSFFQPDGVLSPDCTEFIFTETMRERKSIMETQSSAFIMAPGGPGTLDEFFEILTLKQLRQHCKPIAVFNINGYYNDLKHLLANLVEKRFMSAECIKLCNFFDNADELLDYIENYKTDSFDAAILK